MGWGGLLAGCTKVVGVLGYERVSGTRLELLSAGKVVFWVIQRLSMSHFPIITLSSNQQVLQKTGCATLLALSCKYDFIRKVSVTLWVINCFEVNKLNGGEEVRGVSQLGDKYPCPLLGVKQYYGIVIRKGTFISWIWIFRIRKFWWFWECLYYFLDSFSIQQPLLNIMYLRKLSNITLMFHNNETFLFLGTLFSSI